MVIMRQDAKAEEIAKILEEMRKYGVKAVPIRLLVSFRNKFMEEKE